MNSKVLATVAVVVIVVVLVGSYLYMDDGDDGTDTGPSVLEDRFEVGDHYTLMSATMTADYSAYEYTTYTVTAVDGDMLTVEAVKDIDDPIVMSWTPEDFTWLLVMDDSVLEDMTYVRTETIDTAFGQLECELWRMDIGEWRMDSWILPDSHLWVMEDISAADGSVHTTMELIGGSIFGSLGAGAEPGPTDSLDVREDYSMGDYITYELGGDGAPFQGGLTYTYLYDQEGMDVVWRSDQGVFSTDFLSLIMPGDPTTAGLARDGSAILVTSFGDIMCEIWQGADENGGVLMWVDPVTGVMLRADYSSNAGGEYSSYTAVLTDTSLLGPASPMDPTGIAYADRLVDRDIAPGDFYSYAIQAGIDDPETVSGLALHVNGDDVAYLSKDSWDIGISTGTVQDFLYIFMFDPETYGQGEILRTETISTIAGDVECIVMDVTFGEAELTVWVGADSGVNYRIESEMLGITVTMTLEATSLLEAI